MVTKKQLIAAILATFCLTITLFIVIPTRSLPGGVEYDPWGDIDDSGKIDMYDIGYVARRFMMSGEPINKTALLLELQAKIDNLENRLACLEQIHSLPPDLLLGSVGYWKLDEGNGTLVGDSSGNNNNGTIPSDQTWIDGKYGKALNFDGINDFVSILDSPSLRVQNFSLEAWIYMTIRPYQNTQNHGALINKFEASGGPGTGFLLQFSSPTADNDHLMLAICDSSTTHILLDYNSTNDLTLNNWHHVVGTYDGSVAKLYIDGTLRNTTSPGTYTIVHSNAPLYLGSEPWSGQNHFKGLMDNIIIYNRALSEIEVLTHYIYPPR